MFTYAEDTHAYKLHAHVSYVNDMIQIISF